MSNLYSPNSKLMNPKKRIYSLIDINFFLTMLGLFPLVSVPTSKIIIYFRKSKLSIAIQPVEIWNPEILKIPNYEKFRFEYEESMFPETRMQIDMQFYTEDTFSLPEKTIEKIQKLDKSLEKRGKHPKELK